MAGRHIFCLILQALFILPAAVKGFSHIYFTAADSSGFYLPAFVCTQNIPGSVFVKNMQFCQCGRSVPIIIRCTGKAQNPLIPSIAHDNFQPVILPQFCLYFIGLILQPLSVIRPARRKKSVPRLHPIQPDFIHPQCGGINPDSGNFLPLFFREQEILKKYRTGRFLLRETMGNPVRLKCRSRQQPGFKARLAPVRIALIIPNLYLYQICAAGRKRLSLIRNQHRGILFHPSGIPEGFLVCFYDYPVCLLPNVPVLRFQYPGKPGMRIVQADGIIPVFRF